jgi:branched-chain amino acid transport system substrate-binding protein
LFGADGLDNAKFIELAGPAANDAFMSVPFMAEAANAEGKAFVKQFGL